MDDADLLLKARTIFVTQWTAMLSGVLTRPVNILLRAPRLPIQPGPNVYPLLYPTVAHIGQNPDPSGAASIGDGSDRGLTTVSPSNPWVMAAEYRDQTSDASGISLDVLQNDMDRAMSAFYLYYMDGAHNHTSCSNGLRLYRIGDDLSIDPDLQGDYVETANQVQRAFSLRISYLPCVCG